MLTPAEKQFALLAFSSLFSVINPISAAPIFVAMTADFPERRRRAAPGSAHRDRAARASRFLKGVSVPARPVRARPPKNWRGVLIAALFAVLILCFGYMIVQANTQMIR
jgi:hypothetical protein